MPRVSAQRVRPGMTVVLDTRSRKIKDKKVEEETGTVVLTDTEGNTFRRPPGAKMDVVPGEPGTR